MQYFFSIIRQIQDFNAFLQSFKFPRFGPKKSKLNRAKCAVKNFYNLSSFLREEPLRPVFMRIFQNEIVSSSLSKKKYISASNGAGFWALPDPQKRLSQAVERRGNLKDCKKFTLHSKLIILPSNT